MWDPHIGPTEVGLAAAGFVYGFVKIREKANGGAVKERLARIEAQLKIVLNALDLKPGD